MRSADAGATPASRAGEMASSRLSRSCGLTRSASRPRLHRCPRCHADTVQDLGTSAAVDVSRGRIANRRTPE